MFFGEGRLDLFKAREGVAIAHAFALQCGRRATSPALWLVPGKLGEAALGNEEVPE